MKLNAIGMLCLTLAGVLFLALTAAGPAGAAQYAVTDLGRLDTDPNYAAVPLAINNSGTVVGAATVKVTYLLWTLHLPHAFVWRNGTLSDLGLLAGSGTLAGSGARGINDANYVIGLNYGTPPALGGDTLHRHAFLWPGTGAMTDLGSMSADPNDVSTALAINSAGHIVGTWAANAEPNVPFAILRWSSGVVTRLGTFGGNSSTALDINDSNQVVGKANTADEIAHAFFWQNGVMSDLGTLPGYGAGSTAVAINSSTQVVGTSSDANGVVHSFLYANGTMTDLGTLPGMTSATAGDIDNRGLVAGSTSDPNGVKRAFLWKNGVMYDLNSAIDPASGWVLTSAQVINNNGQIAGSGQLYGVPKGFLMRVYFLAAAADDPAKGSVATNPNQVFFNPNATATLTATANPGFVFDHWSGDVSGSANPASIVMNTCKVVTANFVEARYTLTLTPTPPGMGTINAVPPPAGDGKYAYGTVVTLTANANPGYAFQQWSGDVTGPTNPVTITMTGNKGVIANFVQARYELTLTPNPAGGGTVNANPLPDVDGKYAYGTVVQLTANPATEYTFANWSGDASGSTNPTTVTMNGGRSVAANFVQVHTLTLNVVNGKYGTVTVDPNLALYPHGTVVTLTAAPVNGKYFKQWELYDPNYPGDFNHATIDANSILTITMDGDIDVNAVFQCSSGMGPVLPLGMVGLLVLAYMRRR